MKQLTILVKPFCAEAVLKAISKLDVIACMVQEAKGYSRQRVIWNAIWAANTAWRFCPRSKSASG